ncbi:MAG: AI-2E family transporter [Spirochaetia bacterium]
MQNKWILFSILLGTAVLFGYLARFFFVPFVVALTFATLFHPVLRWVQKYIKNRSLSALILILILFIIFMIPAYFVTQLLVIQAIDFYSTVRSFLRDPGIGVIINKIASWGILTNIDFTQVNWSSLTSQAVSQATSLATMIVNRTSTSVLATVSNIFIIFFAMFYFFRDSDNMLDGIKAILPLDAKHIDNLSKEFAATSRAAVLATLVIGLIQGIVGAGTFLIVGIESWLLWGVVMTILSIIPLVGSYIIMVPAAIFLFVQGSIWAGLFVLVMTSLVSYSVEYLLRPKFVGKDAKMHELVVFVASLGGLTVFGVAGFIVGPVIAAILIVFLRIYKEGQKQRNPIYHAKHKKTARR